MFVCACKGMLALLEERAEKDAGSCSWHGPPTGLEDPVQPPRDLECDGFQVGFIGYLEVELV